MNGMVFGVTGLSFCSLVMHPLSCHSGSAFKRGSRQLFETWLSAAANLPRRRMLGWMR